MPWKKCATCPKKINKGTYCKKCSKKAWKKRNPEKVKAQKSAYRARRKGAPVVEPVSRKEVYARSKGICGICGKKVSAFHFHVDHIIPLSRGGSHTYGNTQASHPSCNEKKGARI